MLEKLRALRNDGPPYYVDEQTGDVSYRDDELIAWGNSLKHGPHHSTSEYKSFRPAGPGRKPKLATPTTESPSLNHVAARPPRLRAPTPPKLRNKTPC